MNLSVKDVKVFVPAKDFKQSLGFYQALGWQANFVADDGGLAELELGGCRFFLQNFYSKELAENFMLYLSIEDAEAWWERVSAVINSGLYGGARVAKPKEEAYGALVTYVWDPSGVLLHFAQPLEH